MGSLKDTPVRAAADEREVAIVHEAGHALIAWLSPFVEEIAFVSVSVRRNSVTQHVRLGRAPFPPVWYWDEARIMLGGLAGQFLSHGVANAINSKNDLVHATATLTEVVTRYGSDSCPWPDARTDFKVDVGKMFRVPPDTEIRRALNLVMSSASALLVRHRLRHQEICALLREQGHLLPEDLTALLGDRPWKPKS